MSTPGNSTNQQQNQTPEEQRRWIAERMREIAEQIRRGERPAINWNAVNPQVWINSRGAPPVDETRVRAHISPLLVVRGTGPLTLEDVRRIVATRRRAQMGASQNNNGGTDSSQYTR